MKKLLSTILTVALLITLLPQFGQPSTVSAAASYFLFDNEQSVATTPRITMDKFVTLTGTLNNVVGSSINYKVAQITLNGTAETEINTTETLTAGITPSTTNTFSVTNVELFAGLNKITFSGTSGTSTVSESIYIEYRNTPLLYDLLISYNNKSFDMQETATTVIYSTSTVVEDTGEIVITGKAPNADAVTVIVNGESYEFPVSSSSGEYRFTSSLLAINKGINTIKLKVTNSGQVVETTRQVAFYNGEITFYDLAMTGTNGAAASTLALENAMNFSTTNLTTIGITGKAIIPLPIIDIGDVDGDLSNTDELDYTNTTYLQKVIKVDTQLVGGALIDNGTEAASVSYVLDESGNFITVSYTFNLSDSLTYDEAYRIQFEAPNGDDIDVSDWTTFTLRNGSLAYIYDINYLSSYSDTMATNATQLANLTGTDIEGATIYSVPMGVEILIGNYGGLTVGSDAADKYPGLIKVAGDTTSTSWSQLKPTSIVTKTVNNTSQQFLRVFVEIDSLTTAGTNTLTFDLNSAAPYAGQVTTSDTKTATVKLLYGAYVKFAKLVDGMKLEYDTTLTDATSANTLVNTTLGGFAGNFYNIANASEIKYYGEAGQSVFLYLNNVEIPLEKVTNSTAFKILPGTGNVNITNAFSSLNKSGENTVKLVLNSANNYYEVTVKFTIIPSNLPVIPAPDTNGVFPYSYKHDSPVLNDPNFVLSNTVYTTTEEYMNVYGTFDFIDFGTDEDNVQSKVTTMIGNGTAENYILQIASPDFSTEITWDLTQEFKVTEDGDVIKTINPGKEDYVTADARVTFYYDIDDEFFYFIIEEQQMPEDGSSMVYNFTVFNSGDAGPRATYRMEIDAISIPYTILAPIVEKRTINSNYVEVIITSTGADSITVGKQTAEKVQFNSKGKTVGMADSAEDNIEAFSVVVKDLKANKVNEIKFTITRGDDEIEGSIDVSYQPANIPGAQFIEMMDSKHSVFNGTVELAFARNTKLVSPNYNSTNNYVGQVYDSNDILFGIANSEDGILDRHDFETQTADYIDTSTSIGELYIGTRFEQQARKFVKASPLIWIDGGMADNPDDGATEIFDPIKTGVDPFPFPNTVQKESYENFYERYTSDSDDTRELVPTEAGELTLSYNSSIVTSAGTVVTVFRFDPYARMWENVGGVVNEKDHTITVPFTKFGYYIAAKLSTGYNDINDHPYARNALEAIYSKGIMNAYKPLTSFGVDQYITRGEFTRMIVRALDLPMNYLGELHFSYDPTTKTNATNPEALYDYRFIETAARAGIVRGTQPGVFGESSNITRQDATVILAKALNLKLETDATKAKAALNKAFQDAGKADYYAIPSILAVQKKGFIQGSLVDPTKPKGGSVFEPKALMLRSDAAIIMAKVMVSQKKLPKIY